MVSLVWLIPALPLLGFVILLLLGNRIGEPWSGWLATAFVAAAFVVSIVVFVGLHGRADRSYTLSLFTWIPGRPLQRRRRASWSTRSRAP